jgi:two-component system, NtrC family, response regulator HydG
MSSVGNLLIVDDEDIALRNLQHVMAKEGYAVTAVSVGAKALALLGEQQFDVVLTDLRMEQVDGMDILRRCREINPLAEVILITGHASTESAVAAMKQGAFYFLAKPYRFDEVRKVVAEAIEKVRLKRENLALRQQLSDIRGSAKIVTRDAVMEHLLELARQIAPTDCTALISGASGTGKELLARYLHDCSGRRNGPYVAINCGAFSDSLLENELFGHEKGAFTGATSAKKGLIESSAGGTLFLDEITEMSAAMQVKLLRVLQEREVLRLGATRPVPCDVRIIGASNRDVAAAVRTGGLRKDLFYRLDVVRLHLPLLSERRSDIPLLALHFLDKYSVQMKRDVQKIAPEAMELLMHYEFPGNVRELENLIARGTAMAAGSTIEAADLPEHLRNIGIITVQKRDGRLPTLEEQEFKYISRVLEETAGNQTAAAQILGINRASLWRKLKGRREQ